MQCDAWQGGSALLGTCLDDVAPRVEPHVGQQKCLDGDFSPEICRSERSLELLARIEGRGPKVSDEWLRHPVLSCDTENETATVGKVGAKRGEYRG